MTWDRGSGVRALDIVRGRGSLFRIVIRRCALICFLAGLLAAAEPTAEASSNAAASPNPTYLDLRGRVLGLTAGEMGSLAEEPVWVVLMEIGFEEGAATLVAAADGTTSLYLSSGGGVLGTGEFAEVKLAAQAFRRAAADSLERLAKTERFPLPAPGEVQFLVLTAAGVFRGTVDLAELAPDQDPPLAALGSAGQQVLLEIRRIEERPQNEAM